MGTSPLSLLPVGFNIGFPPANNPARLGGPPLITPVPELGGFDFPSMRGALLSFVTAFFNLAPALISLSS